MKSSNLSTSIPNAVPAVVGLEATPDRLDECLACHRTGSLNSAGPTIWTSADTAVWGAKAVWGSTLAVTAMNRRQNELNVSECS